jgi:biopolymer transport protein ExbD
MMGKKQKFGKRKLGNEDMSLQITSMADIFIILLVFLLKSFATGAVNLTPTKGMMLPEASAGDASVDALKIEISQDAVQVEGNPVTSLKEFKFDTGELLTNGSSQSLGKALDRERQRQLLIAKANSDVKVDPKVLIVADQRAPYSTVKAVLASAALNGYTDFKLAVVKGN